MAVARDFRQRSLGEGLGKAAKFVNDDLPGVANHWTMANPENAVLFRFVT